MIRDDKLMWKTVKGFDYYLINNIGQVKSLHRSGRLLKPKKDKDGYHEYCLRAEGKSYYRRAHRLVAEAFIENTGNYPVINHKNGIKDDNRVDNLEWCTVAENTIHGYSMNLNKRTLSSLSKKESLEIKELYEEGNSYTYIRDYLRLDTSTDAIGEVLSGKRLSSLTGITEDIRKDYKPTVKLSDNDTIELLRDYYLHNNSQQRLTEKYSLSAAQVHRIVKGLRRKELYESFMDSITGGINDKKEN